jgi:biopolymer transport protein ExbD
VKKVSKGHHSSLNELNITPLLDLAFVLLVIFIIATPQLSNDLEMNLPSAKKNPNPPATPPKIHRIVVETSGRILLNGQVVEVAELKPTFMSLTNSDPDPNVVVRGAPDVNYEHVVTVLDVLQQVNISKVGLATETAQ